MAKQLQTTALDLFGLPARSSGRKFVASRVIQKELTGSQAKKILAGLLGEAPARGRMPGPSVGPLVTPSVPGPRNTAALAAQVGAGKASSKLGMLGKAGLATGIGYMLLDMLLGARNQSAELGMQERVMDEQMANIDPAAYFYESMLPVSEDQRRGAERALMSQLSGGVMGPALARGERWT